MVSNFVFLAGSLALEKSKVFHLKISEIIKSSFNEYHGYVAYKLTTLGRAVDDDVPSFLIVTKEHGIILIDVVEEKVLDEIITTANSEYWKLSNGDMIISRSLILDIYQDEVKSRLKNNYMFYDRKLKKIKIPINCAVIFCQNENPGALNLIPKEEFDITALTIDSLHNWLSDIPKSYNCNQSELDRIYSLMDGTFIYESKKIEYPNEEKKSKTMNDFIQKSLQITFKQDAAQRAASMQLTPGLQRIRGLAGTGKTIVLCIKAAITHKRLENYKILYLFNTQSLYPQIQNLISRYYTLEAKKNPDFENMLQVFHAWGGKQRPGLYSSLCMKYGLTPLTLSDTKGNVDSLGYIYRDLLSKLDGKIEPEYDLILIDEAQDFPSEVFQVIYKLAKGEGGEKRIIWAYDEFQSLRNIEMKEPSELFGKNEYGMPNLEDSVLEGYYTGDIPKDFILPNCYRTPRPVLMIAHGIAMGLYSKSQTEMFFNTKEWEAIGYKVNKPKNTLLISEGEDVILERSEENSHNILERLLIEEEKKPFSLIQHKTCVDDKEQIEFIKNKIVKLVNHRGVAPEEIIIVNLKSTNNRDSMLEIQRSLNLAKIKSVIPGYIESADVFKPQGFVTITTPFRAKGNEANIVFVINSQQVTNDFSFRMRNAFFVAVTRSQGWCYITGYGDDMLKLEDEISKIKQDFPFFRFKCPSKESISSNKKFLNKSDNELNKLNDVLEFLDKNQDMLEIITDRFQLNTTKE